MHSPVRTFVKQYGHQRSGTNVAKALIEANFIDVAVLPNSFGNKHDAVIEPLKVDRMVDETAIEIEAGCTGAELQQLADAGNLKFLFCYKNYIPWLVSYYKYQKKKVLFRDPDAEFEFSKAFIAKASRGWEDAIASWSQFANAHAERSMVVEHEQLLENAGELLDAIERRFGLVRADDDLTTGFEGYARRGTGKEKGGDLINDNVKFDPSYHLEDGWRETYDDALLSTARQKLSEIVDRHPMLTQLPNWRGHCDS